MPIISPCKHRWTTGSNHGGMMVRICTDPTCRVHSFRFSKNDAYQIVSLEWLGGLVYSQALQVVSFILKTPDSYVNMGEKSLAVDFLMHQLSHLPSLATAIRHLIDHQFQAEATATINSLQNSNDNLRLEERVIRLEKWQVEKQ